MKLREAAARVDKLNDLNQKSNDKTDLDLLDYYWFLVSLVETKNNGYRLEILDDETGSYNNYLLDEGNVDDEDLFNLELTLLPANDESSKKRMHFVIENVEDSRIVDGYKYYVTTPAGKYRFVIFKR